MVGADFDNAYLVAADFLNEVYGCDFLDAELRRGKALLDDCQSFSDERLDNITVTVEKGCNGEAGRRRVGFLRGPRTRDTLLGGNLKSGFSLYDRCRNPRAAGFPPGCSRFLGRLGHSATNRQRDGPRRTPLL